MYLYYAFVALLVVAVCFFLFMQVIVPLINGTTLLPFFRSDPDLKRELAEKQRELEELTEVVDIQTQLDEIYRRMAELEKK